MMVVSRFEKNSLPNKILCSFVLTAQPHQNIGNRNYCTACVYGNCANGFHTLRRRVIRRAYTIFFARTVEINARLMCLCFSVHKFPQYCVVVKNKEILGLKKRRVDNGKFTLWKKLLYYTHTSHRFVMAIKVFQLPVDSQMKSFYTSIKFIVVFHVNMLQQIHLPLNSVICKHEKIRTKTFQPNYMPITTLTQLLN